MSRLPLEEVEQLRFPPAGGGEQRTAVVGIIRVGGRAVTVAAAHLSNKPGHNVRQLRQLQGVLADRPAPRLLLGDLNLPWMAVLLASRRGWPGSGRGHTIPNSRPNRQLDHVLRSDPGGCCGPMALGWSPLR